MGQKTHPIGLRLGIIRSWNSKWFAGRSFAEKLHQDIRIRRYLDQRLENAGLANIEILRDPKKVTVDIHTSRPGIVIGRKGAEVDKLREELRLLAGTNIILNIIEVKKPELSARLVADSIARQLEGRIGFRRVMKRSLGGTMKMGAEGIKIMCSGRLGGAEIARSEKYKEGRIPLHTLRADIDYSAVTAHTAYGTIGVKVWICRGEILDRLGAVPAEKVEEQPISQERRRPYPERRGPRRGGGGPRGRIRKVRQRGEEGNDRGSESRSDQQSD